MRTSAVQTGTSEILTSVISSSGAFLVQRSDEVIARSSAKRNDSELMQTESNSTGRDAHGYHRIVTLLLNESALIPISQICESFQLDEVACQRVNVYLGKTLASLEQPLHVKHKVNAHVVSASFDQGGGVITTLENLHHAHEDSAYVRMAQQYADATSNGYADEARRLPFAIATDDRAVRTSYQFPILVRPAPVPDPEGNHVMTMQDRDRYDHIAEEIDRFDIPWSEKSDRLVWRGEARNPMLCTGSPQWPNRSRMLFVQKYVHPRDARIDVGFVPKENRKENGRGVGLGVDNSWSKGRLTYAKQLSYKYIMVVDGNDVASNTEWVMASNSLPFMQRVIAQTWSLHSWLKPWTHFIPVEDDFSDVSAKLDWAVSHPDHVMEIISAGKQFMQEFRDKKREARINAAVLAAYFNRLRIEDSADDSEFKKDIPSEYQGCSFGRKGPKQLVFGHLS